MAFFDPTQVKRETPIELLPAGQYIVTVDKAVEKNRDGNIGAALYFKVISPSEQQGKMIFDYFNISHYSEKAQEIGRQRFAKLLDCVEMGDQKMARLDMVEGKRLKIDLSQEKHYKNLGEFQNKVERHLPLSPLDLNLIKDYKEEPKQSVDNQQKVDYGDIPF